MVLRWQLIIQDLAEAKEEFENTAVHQFKRGAEGYW
jgi:hypothetical protein